MLYLGSMGSAPWLRMRGRPSVHIVSQIISMIPTKFLFLDVLGGLFAVHSSTRCSYPLLRSADSAVQSRIYILTSDHEAANALESRPERARSPRSGTREPAAEEPVECTDNAKTTTRAQRQWPDDRRL